MYLILQLGLNLFYKKDVTKDNRPLAKILKKKMIHSLPEDIVKNFVLSWTCNDVISFANVNKKCFSIMLNFLREISGWKKIILTENDLPNTPLQKRNIFWNVSLSFSSLSSFLKKTCYFFKDKIIADTHVIAILNLKSISDLGCAMIKHFPNTRDGYLCNTVPYKDGQLTNKEPHLIAMVKTCVEETTNLLFKDQQEALKELSLKSKLSYDVPTPFEVIFITFTHYCKTKRFLFENNISTICKVNTSSKLFGVGCFSEFGLCITENKQMSASENIGIAPVIRLVSF